MYGPTAYYLATQTATVVMFILYPVIVTLTSFYFFELDEHTFGSMLDWMLVLTLTAFAGGFWGFTFGTFMKNEIVATQLNLLFLILFCFGAGFYANTGEGSNPVVLFISYISPLRYTTELLMQRIVGNKVGGELILNRLGFTWGDGTCLSLLLMFTILCFIVGWLSLLLKSRRI